MGKGIKTRVAEKGIKAIDKAAVASERMKEAYIRTRDKADHSLYAAESSPGEYASDRFSAGVDNVAHEAVQWFKDRGQWMDGSAEPAPGMIIFFDWNDENGQDGLSDHTGIVEKVENGRVYTIEGNSGDSVRQNSYPVGHYEVLGYGCPDF